MDPVKISALLLPSDGSASVESLLLACGVGVRTALDADEAVARLDSLPFDLVVAPIGGPQAIELLRAVHEANQETPILALGSELDDRDDLMRAALAAGAADYLAWPATTDALRTLLKSTAARGRASTEVASPSSDSGLIGNSPQLAAARETLALAARGSATVLLRGETGTGKDLAARAIHAQSTRAHGPFVKVHTPAVPDALLESELFGYERGAFTGATARKLGRVELAQGGTLFLDEIGDVSLTMQAKLLRLIQDHEYERLGGNRTLAADIRVVAATHRDLEHLVESGQLREDLFYRLNVVTIWLPPLRARREDIAVIANHYLKVFSKANHKHLVLEDAALLELQGERWPGNVRQLVNFIERLVVLSRGERITREDIRREHDEQLAFLTQAAPGAAPRGEAPAPAAPASEPGSARTDAPSAAPAPPDFSSAVRPLKEDLRRTELRAITKALHFANGNRALAARLLGVSRRTLYTKLEEHGIE